MQVRGNYVAAGVGLRGVGNGDIVIAGIPAGATVEYAFLYWGTIGTLGTYTTPTLNGSPVSGALIGTDGPTDWYLWCESDEEANFVYRADVTALVSGNGTYTVAGLPNTLPCPPDDDSQGAALVVIYADGSESARLFMIHDGAVTLTELESYTDTFSGFTTDSPLTQASITYLFGDGQMRENSDGTLLYNGSVLAENTEFILGMDGDYWDTMTYDVTAHGAPDPVSTQLTLPAANGQTDPVVWCATLLAVTQADPDLQIVKVSDASAPVITGATVQYTLTATNNGPTGATGVTVTDVLPGTLAFVSSDCGATFAVDTLTWTVGDLASGASQTCHVNVTVTGGDGTIANTAVIAGNEPDPNMLNNEDTDEITVQNQADLAVVKTSDAMGSVMTGDTVTYTFTVTNNGPSDATGVVLSDVLPAETTYVSNDCGSTVVGSTLTWNIGALANGASASCHVDVTVTGSDGSFDNTANVSGNETDPNLSNNQSTTTVSVENDADVAVVKTLISQGTSVPGGVITFELMATNYGPLDATNAVVTDPLPASLEYESDDCGAGAPVAGVFTWNVGDLAVGATATCNLSLTVISEGAIENEAFVAADQNDPVLSNNQSAARLQVVPTLGSGTRWLLIALMGVLAVIVWRRYR